jgi:hypothetical protein
MLHCEEWLKSLKSSYSFLPVFLWDRCQIGCCPSVAVRMVRFRFLYGNTFELPLARFACNEFMQSSVIYDDVVPIVPSDSAAWKER